MKKLLLTSLLLSLVLCVTVGAASKIAPIDTADAVEVYRNTFDDANALADFTQFRGEWGVENGRAYVLPGQAGMNAYFLYTGENESLQNLGDHVVSVEMYNVRQATGLVARCDLATANTAGHGYMGVNASCSTGGTYFFTRVTNNAAGTSTASLGSAPVIFAPGANIRLEVAMRGKVIQTSAYDLDNDGMLLWVRSGVTDLHPSGSFGLFAYTTIVNGLDVSETRFDNLVVKTLSPVSDAENFDVYATLVETANATEVYRNTFDDASALSDFKLRGEWGVENGRAYVLPGQASMNAYTLYNGSNEALKNLTDCIIEVDIYNLQQAEGLVARCDLATSNEKIQGYMGFNPNFNTAGTKAYNRVTNTTDGSGATGLGTSAEICGPGDDVHLTVVFCGTTVQYFVSDLDTGKVLCCLTAETELHPSGSFGLMAYTKVVNGLDNSESRFDNLVVKTLPANTGEGYEKADFAAKQFGNDLLQLNADGMLAIHKTMTMENGTAEVQAFMPAAATASTFPGEIVKGNSRVDRAGLVFNYAEDGSSYYKLQMHRTYKITAVTDGAITDASTKVYTQLIKVVNGTETELKSYYTGLGSNGPVDLRVVKDGGKIWCYMNDRCYAAIEDAEPLTGTGLGVFTDLSGAAFANLSTSDVTECDKADLVAWGHSHIGGWINFGDVMAEYGKGVNVGIGGLQTKDMPGIINEMASYEPEVVVIMIGSNNYGSGAEKNTADLKKYNEQLHALLPEAKIVVITEWWQPVRLETYGQTVLDLNEAYRAYAAETDYVYIVEGFSLALTNGEFDESKFKDTMHFTPATYESLDDRVCTLIGSFYGNEGDIDGDGDISVKDVLLSLKGLVNRTYPRHADRNFDGAVDLRDCLAVLKASTK